MNNDDWENWVDLYVDGECSSEQKRLFERLSAQNSEIRASVESALEIRRLASAARNEKLPPEFAKMLREKLDASEFWSNRTPKNADFVAQREKKASWNERFLTFSRKKTTIFVAATSASVLGALLMIGSIDLLNNSTNWSQKQIASTNVENDANSGTNKLAGSEIKKNVAETTSDSSDFGAKIEDVVVRAPLAEGENPFSEKKSLSDSDLWCRRAINKQTAKKFSAFCSSLRVDFEKFDDDLEYRLKKITPENWQKIVAWLDQNAENSGKTSDGLVAWFASENASPKDVRLGFELVEEQTDESETQK